MPDSASNPVAMNWLDSNAIRSLLGALILNVLGWVVIGVQTNGWDWKVLVTSTVAILVPFVKRLFDPDVVAPLGFMNRSNAPTKPS